MENITLATNETLSATVEEPVLVEAARSDPDAFAALYRRYVTPVYRYLYKWMGNTAEAEDLTAQVFTTVLEQLGQYREQGHFAAWLFTIARRKAIAAYRQRQHMEPLDAVENVPAPVDDLLEQVAQEEQVQRMMYLVTALPEDQRELLRLRFTACLSYADIAALLDSREAAVKMAVYRLCRKLYEQWETK